jgi:hypothetical protein
MKPRWLVLVLVAATIAVSSSDVVAAKKKRRQACQGGRFVVHEQPLLQASPALRVDGLMVQSAAPRSISVTSGCPTTRLRMKVTKKGITKVKARWPLCTGLRGRVKMKARFDKACYTLTGVIKARKSRFKRFFVATLPKCGDTIYDPAGGEQCDANQGCGEGVPCVECICRPDLGNGSGGNGNGNGGNGNGNGNGNGGGGTTTTTTTLPPPDLEPAVAPAPGLTAEAGGVLPFSWKVTNIGGTPARAPWRDAVYLSTDDEFHSGDIKLAEYTQKVPLAAGDFYRVDADLQIPLIQPGFYYLIVRTDDKNQLLEANELNNEQAVVIEITAPDLEPTKLDPQPKDGCLLEMTWQVQNNGEGVAYPPWHEVLYSSTDEFLDANDVEVAAFDQLTPLDGRAHTLDRTATFRQPRAGTYIILVVDQDDSIFEGDEANNIRVRQLHDGRCP